MDRLPRMNLEFPGEDSPAADPLDELEDLVEAAYALVDSFKRRAVIVRPEEMALVNAVYRFRKAADPR